MGDQNAKVGCNNTVVEYIIWKHGRNDNGERSVALCSYHCNGINYFADWPPLDRHQKCSYLRYKWDYSPRFEVAPRSPAAGI